MTYTPEQQPQDQQLQLEEWHSIIRQIAKLTERKKAIESIFAESLSTKDGQLSTVHNIGDFSLTKKEGFAYKLDKKAYNSLTPEIQKAMLDLQVVQPDIKMSESKVRQLAKEHGSLLQQCFKSVDVNECKIEYKPKDKR